MPSETTPKLNLPLIAAQQAQKHVTHNEALRDLDSLVQAAVMDRDLTAPPATPEEGECYIVAASATGDWAGHEGEIAEFRNGGWVFHAPCEGWRVWVSDEDTLLAFDGSAWVVASGVSSLNPAAGGKVGVNTTADDTNRLAVKSDAVLFSHDDVTPGSGDMRVTVNKKTVAATASLLFQDNWSGRAEFGLTGDDDFHLKVSADGAAWKEALKVDGSTGVVSAPANGFGTGPLITRDYSAAKGTDLVVNGTGLLGNTYNWPEQFVLDQIITPALPASYRYDGYYPGAVYMAEFLPINPHSVYLLRQFIRREGPDSHRQYAGLDCYDVDFKKINAEHHMIYQGSGGSSKTTLAQPLKPGDTKVYLTDASKWNDTPGSPSSERYLSIFGYKNSKGYLYDSYTRFVWWNAFDPSGVDKVSNIVTLRQPLPAFMGNPEDQNGEWPAGTVVANGQDGADYKYCFFNNLLIPNANTWYHTTNWIGGIDTSGTNKMQNFPPGTAYAKVFWLPNISNQPGGSGGFPDSGPDYSVWFAGVSVVEDTSAKLMKNADGSNTIIVPRVNATGDGWYFHTVGNAIVEEV